MAGLHDSPDSFTPEKDPNYSWRMRYGLKTVHLCLDCLCLPPAEIVAVFAFILPVLMRHQPEQEKKVHCVMSAFPASTPIPPKPKQQQTLGATSSLKHFPLP